MSEAQGDSGRTRSLLEEAVAILRESEDPRRLAIALTHLATTLDPADAKKLNEEALSIARSANDMRNVGMVTHNLAHGFLLAGDYEAAGRLYDESLAVARTVGDTYSIAATLAMVAYVRLRRDDLDAARADVRESLALSDGMHDTHSLVHTIAIVAAILAASGATESAARLCGANSALCAQHRFELEEVEAALFRETVDSLRRALGAAFDDEWAIGEKLDARQAVDLGAAALA
jgi:tetratricopeptide (TPR) repeat protein